MSVGIKLLGFGVAFKIFKLYLIATKNKFPKDELVADLEFKVRQLFIAQTDPYGTEWEDHDENYFRYTVGGNRLPKPYLKLRDTGALMNSIFSGIDSNDEAFVGSNLIYASTHQEGLRGVAARPFFPVDGVIPPDWLDEWGDIVINAYK